MKTRIVIGVAVVLLVGLMTARWYGGGEPVQAARAVRGPIRQYVDERGKTRLPRTYLITMPLTARIETIELIEGAPVTKDQVVARVVPEDMQLAVNAARAAVDRLDASILENKDATVEITSLKQAASFVLSMNRTVDAAKNRLTAGRAKLDFAMKHLARLLDLRRRGGGNVTVDEIDRATLAKIKGSVDYMEDRLVYAAMEAMQAATALMPTAIQQYIDRKELTGNVLKKEKVEAQANLDRVLRDQQRGEMASPVDGVVLERPVYNEQYLSAGTVLLKIGRLQELEIEAEILSQDVIHVKEGDAAEIYGPAIGPTPAKGTVHRVFPAGFTKVSSLGVEQQRVRVVIHVGAEDLARLLAGDGDTRRLGVDYRVRVRVFTDSKDDAVVIPRSALFRGADGKWQVFVVDGRRMRLVGDVKVGLMNDQHVEITGGINAGDVVVLAPETHLKDGVRVRAQLPEEAR
jgi:HlyD family secretion protein